MPILTYTQSYDTTAEWLFALIRQPAEMVALAPPELGLEWEQGPEQPEVGDTYTVQAQRWGLRTRIVTEVVGCRPPEYWEERQIRGPLAKWQRVIELRPQEGGIQWWERIEFAPPGGLLGLNLTLARLEADIRHGWDYTHQQINIRLNENR
jgi:hypothetical protein